MNEGEVNGARVVTPIVLSALVSCAAIAGLLHWLGDPALATEADEQPSMILRLAGNSMCVGIAGLALCAALYGILELAGLNIDRGDGGALGRFLTGRAAPTGLTGTGMALRSEVSDHWEMLRARRAMPMTFAIWALPLLGFIGTVIGISGAIGGLGDVFASAEREDALAGVLGALRFAFDTTFVGLVLVIPVMIVSLVVRARSDSVRRHLVSDIPAIDG